jgi:hypothetical protein
MLLLEYIPAVVAATIVLSSATRNASRDALAEVS